MPNFLEGLFFSGTYFNQLLSCIKHISNSPMVGVSELDILAIRCPVCAKQLFFRAMLVDYFLFVGFQVKHPN